MSKHKQPGGIWTAQYAHCALWPLVHIIFGQIVNPVEHVEDSKGEREEDTTSIDLACLARVAAEAVGLLNMYAMIV